MSNKKKIDIKSPDFEADPRFQQGISSLTDLGGRLASFDFTGDLAPLAETIALDPEITRLALEQAQAELGPAFEDTINRVKQEAANANQFESSTFSDALAREGGRLNQAFQGITAGAALNDRVRALQNRIGLVDLGANVTSQGTAFAGQNQAQKNDFNLKKFENQVAIAAFNRDNKGGLFGGITGAAGGALSGFAVGGPAGALIGGVAGGAAGGFGPSGTGGQILNAGATLTGAGVNRFDLFKPTTTSGKSAGNTADLFGGVGENDRVDSLLRQIAILN